LTFTFFSPVGDGAFFFFSSFLKESEVVGEALPFLFFPPSPPAVEMAVALQNQLNGDGGFPLFSPLSLSGQRD